MSNNYLLPGREMRQEMSLSRFLTEQTSIRRFPTAEACRLENTDIPQSLSTPQKTSCQEFHYRR
jgi:hypothetical protein